MISTELSMIQMLDPQRHELSLLQEAFLSKGGTIAVLPSPSFAPPPPRHEPPPRKVKPKAKVQPETSVWLDKMAQRDIEREERAEQRAKDRVELIQRVRTLAETMTYAQAILRLGMSRRSLQKIAAENGFTFQPAINNRRPRRPSEADDIKRAERIRAFKEIGLSRYQAMSQLGVTFKTFNYLLDKFGIDYPKVRKGPEPACFDKKKQG
jgi:hypothetical protein